MKKGLAYKGLNRLAVGDDSHSNVFILDGDNCWRNAIHFDESAANFHENDSHVEIIECLQFIERIKVPKRICLYDKDND